VKVTDNSIACFQTVAQSTPISVLEQAGFFQRDATKIKNEDIYDSQTQANNGRYTKTIHRVGWMTEVRLLFERELKRLHRDKMSVVVRVAR
jgi:hypothetical protein